MHPTLSFISPIPAGNPTPYKFITYGDMGISAYPEADTTALYVTNNILNDSDYRFVLHQGDISYAEGHVSCFYCLNLLI